ncbi:helix-turn-helix domain-containing protein [Actinomadura sp. SCN-SB]|uniref:helix-turn-helix domain-containing protein n=1 Tax=Actinomadura sp. SCN-SB TaxID=3373092 RepID=UPI003752D479
MSLNKGDLLAWCESTRIRTTPREVLVPHRNAPLTELGRLRLARCVVDEGWSLRRAAERFEVSATTAKRWADRYWQQGRSGHERPSQPSAYQPPANTPADRTAHRVHPHPPPALPASPPAWAWHPPRCTEYCNATAARL